MSNKTLFDLVVNKRLESNSEDILITRWGEGTPFEAASQVQRDEETGDWSGYLVFKYERFSPSVPEIPGLQFKYPTAVGASGAVANARAGDLHKTLVGVFEALRLGDLEGWKTEYTKTDVENDTILILSAGSWNHKWGWLLEDLECEGEVNSSVRMFDTPGEAAQAGLKYYEAWLKEFKATGSREGPNDEELI